MSQKLLMLQISTSTIVFLLAVSSCMKVPCKEALPEELCFSGESEGEADSMDQGLGQDGGMTPTMDAGRDGPPSLVCDFQEEAFVEGALSPFCIDRTEVTVSMYRVCVMQGKCGQPESGGSCNWSTSPANKETHPINCLTFSQAQAYCHLKGKELPTAAQWGFAAGGSKPRKYPWGGELPEKRVCWNRDDWDGTCEVRQMPATPAGNAGTASLWDMAGNVWEMTLDSQKRWDGSMSHEIRGGGFSTNMASYLETTYRQGPGDLPSADLKSRRVGFRCVRF